MLIFHDFIPLYLVRVGWFSIRSCADPLRRHVREENLVCDMIFKCPEAKREVRGVLFISVSLIPLLACLQQRSVAGSLYFAVASPMYEYVQSLHSLLRLSRRCVFLVVFGYSTCGMFVQSQTFSLK